MELELACISNEKALDKLRLFVKRRMKKDMVMVFKYIGSSVYISQLFSLPRAVRENSNELKSQENRATHWEKPLNR